MSENQARACLRAPKALHRYATAGGVGAAMAAAAIALADFDSRAPRPTAAVRLASVESTLPPLPLSPALGTDATAGCYAGVPVCPSLFGANISGVAAPKTMPAAVVRAPFGGRALFGLFGPGGLLIGNGLNADPATCGTDCPGGNGGILGGAKRVGNLSVPEIAMPGRDLGESRG